MANHAALAGATLARGDWQLETVTSREDWHATLLSFPRPHVLQTWDWGEVKVATGWTMRPFRLRAGGRVVSQWLLLYRPLPFLPWAIGYIPKGPTVHWENPADVEATLRAVMQVARDLGLLFVKIDPDVDPERPEGHHAVQVLRDLGWRPSPEAIQFRHTVLLDLRPSEDEILARMKPKWRYNIRLAQRRGVRVRQGTLDDLPVFYALYQETAVRDGFLIRPYPYYRSVWEHFLRRDMAVLLVAEWEGRPVAGLMLFLFGRIAWYMYGASASGDVRRHMPNHLLQWEAIRLARARGCTLYDMWGAPERLDPSDPLWGVYRFKVGFGGIYQRWIGPWDYPVHPWAYALYIRVLPRTMHTLSRALTQWRRLRRYGLRSAKVDQDAREAAQTLS